MKNAMLQILAIFIALSSFFCSFAAAEQREKGVLPKHEDFPALVMTGTVTLEHVIDGLHFSVSTSDGQDVQTVRLSGIHIPGIDGNSPSAEAEKAKTLWHELLRSGEKLHLYQTTNARKGRMNRMGHHLAHIVRARDGLWLQGLLLDQGRAYVLPSKRNPEMAAAMYARESGFALKNAACGKTQPFVSARRKRPEAIRESLFLFQAGLQMLPKLTAGPI